MAISISKATRSDITDILNVRAAAYAKDRLHQYGLPGPMTKEQNHEYRQFQLDTMQKRFDMPGRHYFKAVDEASGKIVAFSCWNAPEGSLKSDACSSGPAPELPCFVDKQKFGDIGTKFKEAKAKIMGERDDYWFLQSMCVSPACQGRGIGDQLLKQGLRDLVDRDGLDCYLEASEVAAKLYGKNGFNPEILIPIEVTDGTYMVTTMLRKSRPGGG